MHRPNLLKRSLLATAAVGALTLLSAAAEADPEGPAAGAAESRRITLGDAILMALENNRSIAVERLTTPIRQTAEAVEEAAFDPTLRAGTSVGREHTQGSTKPFRETVIADVDASVGLTQSLPSGTSVDAGVRGSIRSVRPSGSNAALDAGVTVTQALLRGGSRDANLARLQAARVGTAMSEYELRGVIEAVVADVEHTYWTLALADQRIGIYRESLRLAEQQLRETRDRVTVGTLAETELAAAQAEVASRREGLITAETTREVSRLRLLRLLNAVADGLWDLPLEPSDQPEAPAPELDDVATHVALALRLRPDLNQARLQIELQDLEVVQTRNGLLPRLNVFVELGRTTYAESFGKVLERQDEDTYRIAAGMLLELPLGNRAAEARYRRAGLSRQQAEAAVGNLAQLIELDVRTAYVEVRQAAEQVRASTATRLLRQESLRAETEKARVGRSTSILVGQAQRDLLLSQLGEAQAHVTLRRAAIGLYLAEGSLLERRGVEAPGATPQ